MEGFLHNNEQLVKFAAGLLQFLFFIAIVLRTYKWYKRRNAYNDDIKESKKIFDILTNSPGKLVQQVSEHSNGQGHIQENDPEQDSDVSGHLDLEEIKLNLKEEIQTFENVRQKLQKQKGQNSDLKRYILLGLLGLILLFTLIIYINSGEVFLTVMSFFMMLFFGAFIFGIIALVSGLMKMGKSYNLQTAYRKYYKDTVLPAILKALNPTFEFEPDPVKVEDMDGLWFGGNYTNTSRFSNRYFHDVLKGTIHGVNVKIGEMELDSEMGSQTSQATNELLNMKRALILKANFHKNLSGDTVMLPDFQDSNIERGGGLSSTILESLFGEKDRSDDRWNGLQRVQLESPEFESLFNVYSNDQVEARYIFTPTFMEQILALKKETNDAIIFIRFNKKEMSLNIHWRRNYFEPPLVKTPVADGNFLAEAVHEIHELSRLVELMGLNQKLWSYEQENA
jgi:hypothetical protein